MDKGTILKSGEYTPKSLLDKLVEVFSKKSNGSEFTSNDVYQYILKGKLPFSLGGNIIQIKEKIGIKTKLVEVTSKRREE